MSKEILSQLTIFPIIKALLLNTSAKLSNGCSVSSQYSCACVPWYIIVLFNSLYYITKVFDVNSL